jgi:hypothetical protein
MGLRNVRALVLCLTIGTSTGFCQYWSQPTPIRLHPIPVATLEKQARTQVGAKARVDLSAPITGLVDPADSLEPAGSQNVPNYVKAFASRPDSCSRKSRWAWPCAWLS